MDPNCFDAQRASTPQIAGFLIYLLPIPCGTPPGRSRACQKHRVLAGLPAERELVAPGPSQPYSAGWQRFLLVLTYLRPATESASHAWRETPGLDALQMRRSSFCTCARIQNSRTDASTASWMARKQSAGPDDPWVFALARLAIHFKKRELVEARTYLDLLIERYPEGNALPSS